MEEKRKWRFCVVGNIVHEHRDKDGTLYYGTREFTGGTKVYLGGLNYEDGPGEMICVIGLNRFRHFKCEYIPCERIENVRRQREFKPSILSCMEYEECMGCFDWWGATERDRKGAERFVRQWNEKFLVKGAETLQEESE